MKKEKKKKDSQDLEDVQLNFDNDDNIEEEKQETYEEDCECGDCHCEDCECENCECGDCETDECHCESCHENNGGLNDELDECGCCHGHQHSHGQENEYLILAQRLQADFENYRKHVAEQLNRERQEGIASVIEIFLPSLDTFKEAKKSISDENVLAGINMIEGKILDALKSLNVEKIETVGNKFDPHFHNVVAITTDAEKDDDIILDEFQSGWIYNGRVLRYSKVVVNKLS